MNEKNIQLIHSTGNNSNHQLKTKITYAFGSFKLDTNKEILYKNDQEVRIEKRMYLLLHLLIKNSPVSISKTDLMNQLWKNQVVSDWSLSRLISDTRKVLGDDGKTQKFIRTYRSEGFCFNGKVTKINSNENSLNQRNIDSIFSTSNPLFNKISLLSISILILALVGTYQFNRSSQNTSKIKLVKELEQHLILTKTSHEAQKNRRNELGKMLEIRFGLEERKDWEHFFTEYYSKLNKNERFVHEQIRAITEGPIYKGNKNVLNILTSNPELKNDFPSYQALINHLSFWLNKYEKVFTQRKDMCLLYTGEEDGVPFPSSIDQEVADWLIQNTSSKN